MKRVLVVDDEPEVCDMISKVLVRAGFDVRTAVTGEDAVALLTEMSFQLIIVDKNLPRMHGGEVIKEARRRDADVAVILITAYPEPFSLPPERLDGYLGKPFKSLRAIEEAAYSALDSAAVAKQTNALKDQLGQVVAELTASSKRN